VIENVKRSYSFVYNVHSFALQKALILHCKNIDIGV